MLYGYQKNIVKEVVQKMKELHIVLLHADTRTGKTPISLSVADKLHKKSVLFVTKKSAISGIKKFSSSLYKGKILITNYEQLHKIDDIFDFIIVDESHSISAFPRPSLRYKNIKAIVSRCKCDVLLMTATPYSESPVQLYHQFNVSPYSPLKYKSFYKFAHDFIDIKILYINGRTFKKYNKLKENREQEFVNIYKSYIVRLTKKEAKNFGGLVETKEFIELPSNIIKLMNILKKNRYAKITYKGIRYEIVADTMLKLMVIFHQLSSGVIKIDRNYLVLSPVKGEWIKQAFKGKLAIFYMFIGERLMLLQQFHNATEDLEKFQNGESDIFISQFLSGSMGTDLSMADNIIMVNVPFSATVYEQVIERGRMRGKLKDTKITWLLSKQGIDNDVYKTVNKKIDYTTKIFKHNFLG